MRGPQVTSRKEKLWAIVLPELGHLAHRHIRRERANHTLQTGALVNEAYPARSQKTA
jgi:hypothetical protein